jgi:hypothetical protein
MMCERARALARRAVLGLLIAALPAAAGAQGVGVGPLTRTLTATEPTTGVFDWGRAKLAPGFVIEELGKDPNVFDEAVDPKEDWVFRGTPDVALFVGTRFVRFSGYLGSDLAYYHKYTQERSVGREYRGRVDFLLGLLQPFVAGGETRSRSRPNGEIDVRPDRIEREAGGGVAYNFGAFQSVYVAAVVYEDEYRNSIEDGIPLSDALNRQSTHYSAGVRTALTPLAQLTVFGARQQDRFKALSIRNTDSWIGTAALQIGAEAALSGNIGVSYRDLRPVNPLVKRTQSLGAEVGVTYPFLEIGRLNLALRRGLEYSYDPDEAYYEETTANLSYSHRLFGEVDLQVRGSRSLFDYAFSETRPARQDTSQTVGASVGYNLRNRTRVALNYEDARRRSPVYADRSFDRKRVYLSWGYAY